jgi:hypothetical protein
MFQFQPDVSHRELFIKLDCLQQFLDNMMAADIPILRLDRTKTGLTVDGLLSNALEFILSKCDAALNIIFIVFKVISSNGGFKTILSYWES